MAEWILHPGLALVGAALVLPWLKGAARAAVVLAAPAVALLAAWQLPDGTLWQGRFLDHAVMPLAVDRLSRLFTVIFCLMALGGGLFALRQESRLELPAAFLYAGSAVGVALAGDLVTLFVFFELMAVGATLVLWSAASPGSYRASLRYLMIHLLGGMLLFAGIVGHIAQTGDAAFTRLALDTPAHWLMLAGFLVNAGAPPL
jgi:multicomponent Na+:H+ antiporter subunit D